MPPLVSAPPSRGEKILTSVIKYPPAVADAPPIMRVLPRTPIEQILFFETHLPAWKADPQAVGLTDQQVQELSDLADAARAAFNRAASLRSEAHAATGALHGAARALMAKGSTAVLGIKAAARTDAEVYNLAIIPPPRRGGVTPAPAVPRNLSATISANGSLRLTWEGAGPTGTSRGPGARGGAGLLYLVYRKAPGEADPTLITATNRLSCTDPRPPLIRGAETLYTVQARRGERASIVSAPAVVHLPALTAAASNAPHRSRSQAA